MKKVLIANAVPTNNGDAALVFALRDKLIESGYEVVISTLKKNVVEKLYPDVTWIKSEYEYNRIERKLVFLFPKFREKLLEFKIRRNKIYSDIDIVISAPGGYINSYYGIEDRIYFMKYLKELYNHKLIMYSQSVGPLNDRDNIILKDNMNMFDLFMVRDEASFKNVSEFSNVIKTNDAAFLLNPMKLKEDIKTNTVGISVREWGHDGRDKDKYKELIKSIVYECVKNGYDLEFISTCQGLDGYVDDSKIAQEIVDELEDNEIRKKIVINKRYNNLTELRERISTFEFVIGTRLHMCILSILAGVPAFNISYEVKGRECYKILGLSEYSIDYNEDKEKGIESVKKFIDSNIKLKGVYSEKAYEMNKQAKEYFEYMKSKL